MQTFIIFGTQYMYTTENLQPKIYIVSGRRSIAVQVAEGVYPDGEIKYKCASRGYTAWWQRKTYFTFLTAYILVVPAVIITQTRAYVDTTTLLGTLWFLLKMAHKPADMRTKPQFWGPCGCRCHKHRKPHIQGLG